MLPRFYASAMPAVCACEMMQNMSAASCLCHERAICAAMPCLRVERASVDADDAAPCYMLYAGCASSSVVLSARRAHMMPARMRVSFIIVRGVMLR